MDTAGGALVTILFTDLEGSTALQALRGDRAANEVVRKAEDLARAHVAAHGGRVVKSIGDGLMVAFGSPRQGVRCAVEINRSLAEHAAAMPQLACRMRAGLHTGEVLATGDDLHGAAVSAAARICAVAEGSEVLVSDVVRQLCGTLPGISFTSRGRFALKGFPERWPLFRVADDLGAGTERAPFVGRVAQRAEFRDLLERTADGHGAMVLLGGEPGVGKTSLAEQVAIEAQQRGFGVLTGHCHERHIDVPYGPWAEMLGTVARQTDPQRLRSLAGAHAAALAQVAPELREVLPDIPPVVELPAPQRRWYLFNALRQFITAAAESRPYLLLVDDLHWADDSTLLLCEALAEWVEQLRILVVATYRDTPVDRSSRFDDILASLIRRKTTRLLTLSRHDRNDVAEMITAITGDTPPDAVTDAIHVRTEGNAFFVVEVLRHLTEAGRLFDQQGRFRTDLDLDERDVPANARLVIERRLGHLDERTQLFLGLAAVLGRRFDVDELAAVADVGDDELIEALEEAERAWIVTEEQGDGEAYGFAHDLFRHTLLAGLSRPRRRRYHLRAAEAIERLRADSIALHAARIASHLTEAGGADPIRTARYLRLAGERAQAAAAHEEALRYLSSALDQVPSDRDRDRADVLLVLGLAQRSLGQWDEAVQSWDEALTLLESLGEAEAAGALCWDFTRQLTWAYRFPEMAAVAERGLAVLGDRMSPHRARLLVMRGLSLGLGRQPGPAFAHVDEAMRLAEKEGDPAVAGDVWAMASVLHYFFMQPHENEALARPAIEKLRALGALWTMVDALTFLDVSVAYAGRVRESEAIHHELVPLAERLGHWGAVATVRRNRFAMSAAFTPDLICLEALAMEQLKAARETGSPGWVGTSLSQCAVVEFWQGKWPQAFDHLEEGVALASPFWAGREQGLLLVFHAFCGNADAVHTLLGGLEPALPIAGQPNLLGQWSLAIFAAEAVGLVDDRDWARTLYPLIREAMATGTLLRQLDGRLVETSAALAAAAAGLPDEAEAHFEAVLARAESLRHAMDRPHIRHWYGRFLLMRAGDGDVERALRLLHEAVEGYRALDMPRHQAMATELLRTH
jgi:class 3 adenylate cyclase/tetratricopeptide (TPR) repeat protein